MYPAQRLTGLTESVIREMTRLAEKHGALNLSQGFPDFDPPPKVLAAAAEALRSGYNQYAITWGSSRLRTALADKYARLYGMVVDPETEVTITCGVYGHILYDAREHVPLATLPGMAERTITISGVSKTYAATGWRVGWVLAPPALSNAVRTVHDFLTICAPTPLQEAAVVALTLPEHYYVELLQAYTARRDRMMIILDEAGFRAVPPEGSYYVMADFSDIRRDIEAMAFARWLTVERKVAVVPGSSFYHDSAVGQNLVRLAFPKRLETLAEAARRLAGLRPSSEDMNAIVFPSGETAGLVSLRSSVSCWGELPSRLILNRPQ
jgi:aspartate/methionine/tyrosine aminotransferase